MWKKLSNNPIYPTSVRVDVWRAASLLPIRQFYSVTMMLSQPFLMLAVAPTDGTAEGFGCGRGIGRCVGRGVCNAIMVCKSMQCLRCLLLFTSLSLFFLI